MWKKLSVALILVMFFCACTQVPQHVISDVKASTSEIISSQTVSSDIIPLEQGTSDIVPMDKQATLTPEVKEYIRIRVYGLTFYDTFYNFKGIEELTPQSLRGYLMEAYYQYPFFSTNFIEDKKQGKPDRMTYEQIMHVLKEEFEIEKFPFETINTKDLYLNVARGSGDGLGEIISITQNGDYLSVLVMRKSFYEWYEPKTFYEVNGKYFHVDWNPETSPYIIRKQEFIFKIRENKMPMLVEGKIVKTE